MGREPSDEVARDLLQSERAPRRHRSRLERCEAVIAEIEATLAETDREIETLAPIGAAGEE